MFFHDSGIKIGEKGIKPGIERGFYALILTKVIKKRENINII
jgi:hypothetical protein